MYAEYFSIVIKNNGVPHLGSDQWCKLLNIGAVEYHMKKLEKIKNVNNKVFLEYHKQKDILDRLTGKKTPKEVLEELVRLSNG